MNLLNQTTHKQKKLYTKPSLDIISPEKVFFGIIVMKDGKITFMNSYAKKMIDYLSDEAIQKDFISLFQIDFQETIQQKIDMITGGEFSNNSFIAKILDKYGNGKIVEVELSSIIQNNELLTLAILYSIKENQEEA